MILLTSAWYRCSATFSIATYLLEKFIFVVIYLFTNLLLFIRGWQMKVTMSQQYSAHYFLVQLKCHHLILLSHWARWYARIYYPYGRRDIFIICLYLSVSLWRLVHKLTAERIKALFIKYVTVGRGKNTQHFQHDHYNATLVWKRASAQVFCCGGPYFIKQTVCW